jgi:uncharacterized protein YifE (UPF0438 family)
MLDEARKREKAANAFLAATMALSAAQSPKDFVKMGDIEKSGTALMQRWGRVRGEAERNLDSGVVVPRNKKMKTFKEFVEEAYLLEMRKEDKVKGKEKTPMYLSLVSKKVEKTPEGKLEVRKTEYKRPNPDAVIGRRRQGMTAAPEYSPHPGWGSEREQLRRQPQGGGGSGAKDGKPGELRGKKKVPGAKRERDFNTDGPSPAMKVGWAKSDRANKGKDIFSKKSTL